MCAQTKQTKKTLNTPVLKTVTEIELGISDSKEISPKCFAVAVRKLLQNWRQGTLGVKTRAEVSLSGKKPWKQKGTGRARAGNARSPLWRKGGVAFGPQPRTRTLSFPKKMVRGVLASLVSHCAKQGKIHSIDWQLSTEKPKTAEAYALLKNIGLAGKKVCLFVPFHDQLTYMSFMNIPNVNLLFFDEPNAVHLAGHEWLILDKDFDAFKQMVSQWI